MTQPNLRSLGAVFALGRLPVFQRRSLFESGLGLGVIKEVTAGQTGEAHVGFGDGGEPFFWIRSGAQTKGRTHVAFTMRDPRQGGRFYRGPWAAAATTARRARGRTIIPIIIGRSSSTRTATKVEAVCHRPGMRGTEPPQRLKSACSAKSSTHSTRTGYARCWSGRRAR